MSNNIELKLSRENVGQVLDCLEYAAEDWARTRVYHESGEFDFEAGPVRECNDAYEAGQIEASYNRIIEEIRKQLARQV